MEGLKGLRFSRFHPLGCPFQAVDNSISIDELHTNFAIESTLTLSLFELSLACILW